MVPEGWREVTYEDVCDINGRSLPASTSPDFTLRYLDISSVPELGRIALDLETYRFDDAPSRARRVVQQGDLIISTVRPYLRAFARISVPDADLVASTGFAVLTPRPRVSSEFLFQTVCSDEFVSQLEARMVGSSYPAVNNSDVAGARLLLPPLPEQKKIAAILSSVDDAIAATRKVIEQTKQVKKGLLQTLMTRGIGHTRFKKTEIGEIPEEWEVVPMGTLGIVQGGRQRSPGRRGSPRPYLRVANVFHGHIDTSDVLTMPFTDSEFETYRLREGDILLNEGQSLNLVGRSATYRGQPPDCCFQNTLIRFRAGGRITVSFAQELLHQLWYVGRLAEIATQTTSVAHLGLKRFAALKVAVPPLAEQARIAGVLAGFDLEPSSGSLASLQTLKRGLLQDLLTGRVRVTPD